MRIAHVQEREMQLDGTALFVQKKMKQMKQG